MFEEPGGGTAMLAKGEPSEGVNGRRGGDLNQTPGDKGSDAAKAGGGGLRAFHGTNGDNVLSILNDGSFKPSGGKVWLSETVDATFVHGADRARGAAFSIEVDVLTDSAAMTRMSTPNVPRTILLESASSVPAQIRRLHVRMPDGEGGFSREVIEGADAIRQYLTR